MKVGDMVLVIKGTYKGITGKIVDIVSDPSELFFKLDSTNNWIAKSYLTEWKPMWEHVSGIPTIEFQLNPYVSFEKHGNWTDIVTPDGFEVTEGQYIEVKLGVRSKLPHGFEAHILPRSSTFRKYGLILVNGMGIVDEDYNLEWGAFMYATRDAVIPNDVRLIQFAVERTQLYHIDYVETLSSVSNRGESGHTGV